MGDQQRDTAFAILEAGQKEFLTYGYEKASMRRIAKAASVTTGAIYGYFSGKEALFQALVGDSVNGLLDWYQKIHVDFSEMPPGEQAEGLMIVVEEYTPQMLDYVYDHFEAFKLFFGSGTPEVNEDYLERLGAIEEKSTWDFIHAMEQLGHKIPELDETLVHILAQSLFQQIREFVIHDVPREKAVSYAVIISRFQHAGWMKIMGLM